MARFTTANSREMAARSHAARQMRATEREAEDLSPQTKPQPDETAGFIAKRLSRVRKQLERLDTLLEKETDPMKLDRLASAQARLADQERVMAGRPLPGSHRPSSKDNRPSIPAIPIDPEE